MVEKNKEVTMEEKNSSLKSQFSELELEVSDILLNLDKYIYQSSLPLLKWGTKRKRSAEDVAAAPSPPPPPPPPAGGGGCGKFSDHRRHVAANSSPSLQIAPQKDDKLLVKKSIQEKTEDAASPPSPLSFYPSETDDKFKHSLIKNSSKKRMSRGELLQNEKELAQTRDVLRREIENVKSYYKQLKAYNVELKAMKEEIISSLRKQVSNSMIHGLNIGQRAEIPLLPLFPSRHNGNGLGTTKHMNPSGALDVNVSAEASYVIESSQPLNLGMAGRFSKDEAAENRRQRKKIIAIKKNEKQSRW